MKIVDLPKRDEGPSRDEWYEEFRVVIEKGFTYFNDLEILGFLSIMQHHILCSDEEEDE